MLYKKADGSFSIHLGIFQAGVFEGTGAVLNSNPKSGYSLQIGIIHKTKIQSGTSLAFSAPQTSPKAGTPDPHAHNPNKKSQQNDC